MEQNLIKQCTCLYESIWPSNVFQVELLPAEDLVDLVEEGINPVEAAEPLAQPEELDIEGILADAPPEPVGLDAPPPPELPRARQGPEDRVIVEVTGGGRIVYYRSRNEFYAECPMRGIGHSGNCRRARTAKASENSRRPAQGRPLGLLLAWCEAAESHDSSDSHKLLFETTHEERKRCRQHLKTLPGSGPLFQCERPLLAGEDSEPEEEP